MRTYKTNKKAIIYANVNGNIEPDFPRKSVSKGKSVSGSIETLIVSSDEGSQDKQFLKVGNNKFILLTDLVGGEETLSADGSTGNASAQKDSSAVPSVHGNHTVWFTGGIGAAAGAIYAHLKGEGMLISTIIGAALGVGAGLLIKGHSGTNTTPIPAPVSNPTPAAPNVAPATTSGFDGKLTRVVKQKPCIILGPDGNGHEVPCAGQR